MNIGTERLWARVGGLALASGLLLSAAAAEPAKSVASLVDCSKCMPAQGSCEFLKKWRAGTWDYGAAGSHLVIADVEHPRFKDTLVHGRQPASTMKLANALYTFPRMTFMRNDLNANEKTPFAVAYTYSLVTVGVWQGIYLDPMKRYLIVAGERSTLYPGPTLTLACELPSQ